ELSASRRWWTCRPRTCGLPQLCPFLFRWRWSRAPGCLLATVGESACHALSPHADNTTNAAVLSSNLVPCWYGDAVPVVVAGVTTCQGGRESRPQGEGEQVIGHHEDREVCVMQNAETVLGVLRERGRRGLPLDELYRQLFNPQLYLLAYGRIYSNDGAMTPGVTRETVVGMSLGRIGRIIDAVRHVRYRFS